MEKEYRKKIDFSDKESKRLCAYEESGVNLLIESMPMMQWISVKGSMTRFEDGPFQFRFEIEPEDSSTLYRWTKEVCEYRLHYHFERKGEG